MVVVDNPRRLRFALDLWRLFGLRWLFCLRGFSCLRQMWAFASTKRFGATSGLRVGHAQVVFEPWREVAWSWAERGASASHHTPAQNVVAGPTDDCTDSERHQSADGS